MQDCVVIILHSLFASFGNPKLHFKVIKWAHRMGSWNVIMSLFAEEFLAILTVVNRSDVAHNPYRFLDCCRCLLCRGFVFYERRFFSAVFLHHTNPVVLLKSGKEKSAGQTVEDECL